MSSSVELQPWGRVLVLIVTPEIGRPVQAVLKPADALALAVDLLEWPPVADAMHLSTKSPPPLAPSRWALLELEESVDVNGKG